MTSSGPTLSSDAPVIQVHPMVQGVLVQAGEDWSGFSNAKARRRLQNRLNQRSSRRRKAGHDLSAAFREAYERSGKVIRAPRVRLDASTPHSDVSFSPEMKTSPENDDSTVLIKSELENRSCAASRSALTLVRTSRDFKSYIAQTSIYPLSVDHALLTLMHFNLVRALVQNATVLNLDPLDMDEDILSPWNSETDTAALTNLPSMLRPTHCQLTIPHHPEIDVLPFANYRDNLILAGTTVDDVEICVDMMYGVDTQADKTIHGEGVAGARTGFIVWGDPNHQCNWEIDEAFFLKWKHLFHGCQDVIDAANYWRSKRDEPLLVIEEEF